MNFILNQRVEIEESLQCEFKEVTGQPLQSIKKHVDRYVVAFLNAEGGSIYWGIRDDRAVTGLRASHALRDEIRQLIGQKVASIAPLLPSSLVAAPFHNVINGMGENVPDVHVLEVKVEKPQGARLFLTGAGEAYRRTFGGVQKLTGAELLVALTAPLAQKVEHGDESKFLSQFPTVVKRAELVAPLIRDRRVLWVDDNPSYTFYERVALAEIGVKVDVATSSDDGLAAATALQPHVVVSDIARDDDDRAGLTFLSVLRSNGVTCPVVFYVGRLDKSLGVPPDAFGITNRPDEVLHLILDVFERS